MNVLIKSMEMPTSCGQCNLKTVVGLDKEKCLVSGVEFYSWDAGWGDEQRRHESCPLISVPPHGRLIDADAFTKNECNNCDGACEALPCDCLNCEADCRCDFMKDIAEAPTVISAEEGET